MTERDHEEEPKYSSVTFPEDEDMDESLAISPLRDSDEEKPPSCELGDSHHSGVQSSKEGQLKKEVP